MSTGSCSRWRLQPYRCAATTWALTSATGHQYSSGIFPDEFGRIHFNRSAPRHVTTLRVNRFSPAKTNPIPRMTRGRSDSTGHLKGERPRFSIGRSCGPDPDHLTRHFIGERALDLYKTTKESMWCGGSAHPVYGDRIAYCCCCGGTAVVSAGGGPPPGGPLAEVQQPAEANGPPPPPTSPTSKLRIDVELVERDTSPSSETQITWFGSVNSAILPDEVRYVARPSTNLTFASHLSARCRRVLFGSTIISTTVPRDAQCAIGCVDTVNAVFLRTRDKPEGALAHLHDD